MTRGEAQRKTERAATAPRRASARPSRLLVYALAFAFFALPLFILPQASEYGYTKTIAAIVVVSVLVTAWGIESWRKGAWTIRVPWIAWPVLALVAASLFSLLGAANGRFVVQSLVLFVTFFVLFVLVTHAARDKRDVTILLGSFLVSTALVALYGLLQYLGVLRGPGDGTGLGQVISTLGNKEYVAGVLAYILLPSVVLLVRARSIAWRLAVVVLIAFSFGSLMLFEQTGANVALVAGVLVSFVGILVFRPIDALRKARVWLLVLLGVLAFAYLVEAPSGPLNSVVGLSADSPSWLAKVWERNSGAVRAWDWWVGIEMWRSSPWVGIGLGNYKLEFLPAKARFLQTPQGAAYDFHIARAAQAHNEYIQVLAEMGILGVLALGALLATAAASLVTRAVRCRDEDDRLDFILYAGGLAAVVVHALVSFPAHLPASSLAALLILGLALSRAYGDTATREVTLRGWGLRAAVIGTAAVGLAVSIVAVRDLAANVLMRNGIIQLQMGQTALARDTLERSLRLDFAPHQTLFYLGMAQAQLGDTQAAYKTFSLCRTRFLDENTYLVMAELAANLGKTDEAEETLGALLASRPSPTVRLRALYVKAGVAIRRGDREEATRQLASLVSEAPDFEPAGILYANLLAADGSRDAAVAEYQRVLAVIERKLAAAEKDLAAKTSITAAAYGELRASITTLRAQRDAVRERLKSLGGS